MFSLKIFMNILCQEENSLQFLSQKIVPIVGCAEVRSASGKADALPNVSTSYNNSISVKLGNEGCHNFSDCNGFC